MMEASFTATLDDLDSMIDHILCYAKALCFSKEQLFQIELAAEEALVNICTYAYPKDAPGPVSIRCSATQDKGIHLVLRDEGIPFDPVEKNRGFDPEEKRIRGTVGGYGIFLMHSMVDQIQYHREGTTNTLTLIKQNSQTPNSKPQEALRN